MAELLYTAEECRTEIRRINDLIKEISAIPAQQGGDGLYASYAGRISDLRKERETWLGYLAEAEAAEDAYAPHAMQGPKFKV